MSQRLQFDHFEILTDSAGAPARLGAGGMGTTFKAFDTRLKRQVALKIINERLLAESVVRNRFFNEARAAALIDHPNVARVLYLCPETADQCFFAMEFIDGESLYDRIRRLGPMPAKEALLILRAVVDALAALGEHGLVHRDIKPGNIMIARGGSAAARVKLIDFGLAKLVEDSAALFEPVDTGAHFIGSVQFASPEQINPRGGVPLDCRSDFYAVGATLWFLLVGGAPFKGTAFEVQQAHVNQEPPWEKIAALPMSLQALMRRMLAKKPEDRPANANELLAEWDAALAGLEGADAQALHPLPRESTGASPTHGQASRPKSLATPSLLALAVDNPPPGCTPPHPPLQLARETRTGEWLALRKIPNALPAELREELLANARKAAASPNPGFLNVREVRDREIVSEWSLGISVAHLMARQRGLPLSVVEAWLPKVAEAVDAARELGLHRIGLSPGRWLVAFESLNDGETPADRAARPPEQWGAHSIALDPLSGFDVTLTDAATDANARTILVEESVVPKTTPEWIAAFARAVHPLCGGHEQARLAPLPSLNEGRNRLLLDAVAGRSRMATVSEWVEAFINGEDLATVHNVDTAEVREAAPIHSQIHSSHQATVHDQSPPLPFPIPQAPPHRPPPLPPLPQPPREHKKKSVLPLVAILSVFAIAAAAGVGLWLHKNKPAPKEKDVVVLPEPDGRPGEDSKTGPTSNGWTNSIGMIFVPAGTNNVLFSIYETRNRDWDTVMGTPGAELPDLPKVNVNWAEAQRFCEKLTIMERASGQIRGDQRYRLPLDAEWSAACGIESERGESPMDKHKTSPPVYEWGTWPPPNHVGNLADEEIKGQNRTSRIRNYQDGYQDRAPVGKYKPNKFGIYDLVGNVSEYCADEDTNTKQGFRISRGSSYIDGNEFNISLSARDSFDPKWGSQTKGFRCVLATER